MHLGGFPIIWQKALRICNKSRTAYRKLFLFLLISTSVVNSVYSQEQYSLQKCSFQPNPQIRLKAERIYWHFYDLLDGAAESGALGYDTETIKWLYRDSHPAYRLGVSYPLPAPWNYWEASLDWAHFSGKHTVNIAELGIETTLRLKLNLSNLECRRKIYKGRCIELEAQGGVSLVDLNFNQTETFERQINLPVFFLEGDGIFGNHLSTRLCARGIGPRVGARGKLHAFYGFGLYGNVAAAVPWLDTKCGVRITDTLPKGKKGSGDLTLSAEEHLEHSPLPFSVHKTKSAFHSIIDSSAGLFWQHCFRNNHFVEIGLGVEATIFSSKLLVPKNTFLHKSRFSIVGGSISASYQF